MKLINSAARYKAIGPYSQAVLCNNLFFSSGVIGVNSEGVLAEGLENQMMEIFENMKSVLSQEELDFKHIIKTTVFLSNMNDYADFNALYAQVFSQHRPARSTVQVVKLPKNALVEIEFIAVKE
jgi:2-iminobutanoate/2-iminopropanoate deaminase